ncbi:MAG TPA: tetratricopeptide repeat protein [Pseudolabrys sp.]|nr:tetratricopeptide repeat protein [Pseudolabrys sp.]
MPGIQDMFAEAFRQHQAGRLGEAERLYRQILAADPRHAASLNMLGVVSHQTGRRDLSVELFGQAVAIDPDSAEYRSNLGIALQEQGRHEEAIASYRTAIALKPDYAEAHNNLGIALSGQGKRDEAVASFARALELRPDNAVAHNNLGNLLRDLGRLDEAVACYRDALALMPGYVEAHNNLGCAYRDQGMLDEARACFRHALGLRPGYAEAHSNLGIVLRAQGSLDEAAASYGEALALKSDFQEALNNLANLLAARGEPLQALGVVRRSLRIKETPEAKDIFVACIKPLRFKHLDEEVRAILVRAVSEPWGRPTDLALAAVALVKANPGVGEGVARASAAWPRRLSAPELFGPSGLAAAAADPLLRSLLETVTIPDVELERFLTMSRHAMLEPGAADSEASVLDFHCALAQQCFINEYVYAVTAEETVRARSLRDALAAALETGASVAAGQLVAAAAYFPLHSIPHASRLVDMQWPDAVNAVLTQQIREPAEERQCGESIPRLTAIDDEVSLKVQHQYEENPYPRWIRPAPIDKAPSIDVFLHRHFPRATFQPLNKTDAIDILIAGCGTGQHSIEAAERFASARMLAVDLSVASLSYAKRKSQALGLTTIDYAQADILKLASLDRSFDLIESVGVLHHLDDPLAGWRVLLSLLRPGGFMRLGFYSEIARRDIVRIRTLIAERGYGRTADEIGRARQDLIGGAASGGFTDALAFNDFFSISECRDMLFHVQEHRLTIPEIESFLEENDLQFIGFDLDLRLIEQYQARFPDDKEMNDLKQWHVFETDNPNTFTNMYQFYAQKPR